MAQVGLVGPVVITESTMDVMSETPPPPPEFRHLDFSEFHPLTHHLWQCGDYPGGPRRHLQMAWQLKWRSDLHRLVLCRLGRHKGGWTWRPGLGKAYRCCVHCWIPLAPPAGPPV